MTEKPYWYSPLAPEAVAEARIIVDAFGDRGIEIGGFPDGAEEDDDVEPDGIAFMYAKGHILVREQYLGGAGGTLKPQPVQDAGKQRGVLDILRENRVEEVEVRRVVRDILLLRWDPHRGKGVRRAEPPDVPDLLDIIDAELGVGIATPDHVVTAAQHTVPCASTEPGPPFPTVGPYPRSAGPAAPGYGFSWPTPGWSKVRRRRSRGSPAWVIPTSGSRTAGSCPTGTRDVRRGRAAGHGA